MQWIISCCSSRDLRIILVPGFRIPAPLLHKKALSGFLGHRWECICYRLAFSDKWVFRPWGKLLCMTLLRVPDTAT